MQRNETVNSARTGLILSLIAAAMISRLIPHPPNFTALAVTGLFGGFYLRSLKLALVMVFVTMFLSDWIIGFHSLMPVVYAAMAIPVVVGWRLRDSEKKSLVLGGAVGSSFSFFLVTNFAVWFQGTLYPKTASGLAACYIAGLPFLKNQLAGDLFFGVLLFGALHLAERISPTVRLQPSRSPTR